MERDATHLAEIPRVDFRSGSREQLQFVDRDAVLAARLGLDRRDQLRTPHVPDFDALVLED